MHRGGIHGRWDGVANPSIDGVAHHADDFQWRIVGAHRVSTKRMTNRVRPVEEPACERLVHDGDEGRSVAVAVGERTPCDQALAVGLEEFRRDLVAEEDALRRESVSATPPETSSRFPQLWPLTGVTNDSDVL